MDLFQFENASSQHHGLNSTSNYDFGALSPTTPEPDMMFGNDHNSPHLHIDPGNVWKCPMPDSSTGNSMGKLLNTYNGQAEQAFGQVTPPDESEFSGFPDSVTKRADSGVSETMNVDPALGASPSSSLSSRRKSSAGKSSPKVSKDSRTPEGEGRAGGKKDKYREKNRVAAAKCRAKKKEHVDVLEDSHRTQSALNAALKQTEKSLRDELSFWRTQALQHTFCNCVTIQEYNMRKAQSLSSGFGANLSTSTGRPSGTASGLDNFHAHSLSCAQSSSPGQASDSRTNSLAYSRSDQTFQNADNGSQETSPMMPSAGPSFSEIGGYVNGMTE